MEFDKEMMYGLHWIGFAFFMAGAITMWAVNLDQLNEKISNEESLNWVMNIAAIMVLEY